MKFPSYFFCIEFNITSLRGKDLLTALRKEGIYSWAKVGQRRRILGLNFTFSSRLRSTQIYLDFYQVILYTNFRLFSDNLRTCNRFTVFRAKSLSIEQLGFNSVSLNFALLDSFPALQVALVSSRYLGFDKALFLEGILDSSSLRISCPLLRSLLLTVLLAFGRSCTA